MQDELIEYKTDGEILIILIVGFAIPPMLPLCIIVAIIEYYGRESYLKKQAELKKKASLK